MYDTELHRIELKLFGITPAALPGCRKTTALVSLDSAVQEAAPPSIHRTGTARKLFWGLAWMLCDSTDPRVVKKLFIDTIQAYSTDDMLMDRTSTFATEAARHEQALSMFLAEWIGSMWCLLVAFRQLRAWH